MSAMKAGMFSKTQVKYLRQANVLEPRQAPELEAKALFEHLAQCHPGGVKAGLFAHVPAPVEGLLG